MSMKLGLTCHVALALAMLTAPNRAAADSRARLPETIALPNGFRPEGIAISGTTIYAGSIRSYRRTVFVATHGATFASNALKCGIARCASNAARSA